MAKSNSDSAVRQRREHWRELLGRWQASGLSQAAFCRQERINVWQFAWWKKRLGVHRSAPSCGFVPVQVVAGTTRPADELALTLPGGRVLRFGVDVEAAKLARIVAALDVTPC